VSELAPGERTTRAGGSNGLQRRERLCALVARRGFASVAELARAFGVSEMTIRRDLDRLAAAGLVVRAHGGAVARERAGVALALDEPSFRARLRRAAAAKLAIARRALELVPPGCTLGLDVGTTTFELARALAPRDDVRVFTNSLQAASVLGQGRVEVYLPGGRIRPRELSLVGSIAARELSRYWLDLAFLGAAGVTADGFFDYSLEDTEIKQVYLARARRVVFLCDSTKFARMSVVKVCALEQVHTLVTEASPPPPLAAALARAGVEVVVAQPQPELGVGQGD